MSEYAFGGSGWMLTVMFLAWGCAEFCAAAALAPHIRGFWGRVALVLLVVSGLGAVMGGIFDIRHPLHGAAFGIGVPFLPAAALIVSVRLSRRCPPASPQWSAT